MGSVSAAGHGSASGGGGDTDGVYRQVMTRLREEQEQLGQVIWHPF